MKALRHSIGPAIGIFVLCLASGAAAQAILGQGKSPAQLFASDCSICHKSPQGLAKAGGILGLDSFLRSHYTASRESAAALANYLKSMDSGPAAPARAGKRTAKGSDKGKADEKKKPEIKPGEAKGTEKAPEAKAPEPKSSEPKSAEPKPAEAKASEPKASEPKAGASPAEDAKPAESAKPEKPE
jgi:hypothetical protein